LGAQARATGSVRLARLLADLEALPGPEGPWDHTDSPAVPIEIEHGGAVLRLISTTTVFGAPREVALAELAIECFLPADDATASILLGR
jgi:hypothetical protein